MVNNNKLRNMFGSVTNFPVNLQSNAHFGSPLCQGFPLVPRTTAMVGVTAIATDEYLFTRNKESCAWSGLSLLFDDEPPAVEYYEGTNNLLLVSRTPENTPHPSRPRSLSCLFMKHSLASDAL